MWILSDHKTAAKTGRPRIIHLTDRVLEMCRDRAAAQPTGPLFRNSRGNPWSSAKRITNAFRDLRTKLGLPKTVVPYSLRHQFVSEALAGGVPDTVVAALVGHAGDADDSTPRTPTSRRTRGYCKRRSDGSGRRNANGRSDGPTDGPSSKD